MVPLRHMSSDAVNANVKLALKSSSAARACRPAPCRRRTSTRPTSAAPAARDEIRRVQPALERVPELVHRRVADEADGAAAKGARKRAVVQKRVEARHAAVAAAVPAHLHRARQLVALRLRAQVVRLFDVRHAAYSRSRGASAGGSRHDACTHIFAGTHGFDPDARSHCEIAPGSVGDEVSTPSTHASGVQRGSPSAPQNGNAPSPVSIVRSLNRSTSAHHSSAHAVQTVASRQCRCGIVVASLEAAPAERWRRARCCAGSARRVARAVHTSTRWRAGHVNRSSRRRILRCTLPRTCARNRAKRHAF